MVSCGFTQLQFAILNSVNYKGYPNGCPYISYYRYYVEPYHK